MDRFLRGSFRLAAENKYLKLRRTEFQAWFGEIMGKAYPLHYENIRLTKGDGGLDGVRVDNGFAYAVYAPRETTKGKLEEKILSDFQEGLSTLEERGVDMKGWVFVHNDEGLTKEVGPALMKLRQDNPGIEIQRWTFEGIWNQLERLSEDQLSDLFGPGPTEENVDQLEMPQIREVIEYLAREVPPPLPMVESPDPEKLDFNKLSEENANLMRVGERRSGMVGKYLGGMTDVTAGEAIAEAFRRKYAALKEAGMTPDQIFGTLWRFAGGNHFTEPTQIAAIGAVISYYFNSCDIFENAPTPGDAKT
jgi:hypothetical protein